MSKNDDYDIQKITAKPERIDTDKISSNRNAELDRSEEEKEDLLEQVEQTFKD